MTASRGTLHGISTCTACAAPMLDTPGKTVAIVTTRADAVLHKAHISTCPFSLAAKPTATARAKPPTAKAKHGDLMPAKDGPLFSRCEWGECAMPATRLRFDGVRRRVWVSVCDDCARKPV